MNPVFPSLMPRYVDENWFRGDKQVDECAKLAELEANMEHGWYQNRDIESGLAGEYNEDDDVEEEGEEDEGNERIDDNEDNEDIEDNDDVNEQSAGLFIDDDD